ncbi:MAG: TonB-dependent receptor [Bacteroidales bacterium]|nr:TonB-dependent receptor [Bacteroidales bacterium]
MMKYIFIFLLFICNLSIIAQKGRIEGLILNEANNEPIPLSNIQVVGTSIGTSSDFNGRYIITGLDPGFYQLQISSVGFKTLLTQDIQVINNKTTYADFRLEEQSYLLNQVNVTAERFVKKAESPLSMRSISIAEIENSAGANRDIARIIQNYPGISAFPVANRNDIIVRGGATNESKYFVDDIEIPYINHFSTQGASGGTNGILNSDFIRDVNFYASAFPANRYNAVSGIFDFKLIDGNKEKSRFRTTVGASELALSADGPISENTTYLISLRRSYLQLLFKALGLPFLPTFNDYQAKIKHKINQKNEITILSIGALDLMKLDTELKNPTEYQQYILNYLPVFQQWNYTFGVAYKHFQDNGYTTIVVSRNMLNNTQTKYYNNIKSEQNKLIDYVSQEHENKFRLEQFTKHQSMRILYGFNVEHVKYENTSFQKLLFNNRIDTFQFQTLLNFLKYGAYVQLSQRYLSERLTLSGGVRMDGNTYSSYMANLAQQISPRVAASYDLTELWSINTSWGYYHQLPAYTSMGYKNKEGKFENKQSLKYIAANHFVAGISHLFNQQSKISIEAFYKHYSRYPFSLLDSIPLSFKPIDFGFVGNEPVVSTAKGRAYGVELLLQSATSNNWNWVVSYTYAISQFKDKRNNYRSTSWDNRHILNITANKKFKKNWKFAMKWRFAGGLPYTPYDIDRSRLISNWDIQNRPYLDYNKINEERFKPFHQLDVRIEKMFLMKRASLRIYIDVQNAYNYKSEEQPRLTNLNENGQKQVDPNDPTRYLLREIPADGAGTVLPTIGIILDF